MGLELVNMHFYFPKVATLLATRNNKQPTEEKNAKQNGYYFQRSIRESFCVGGRMNTATQAGKLHCFQSAPAMLNKVIKTVFIPSSSLRYMK